MGGLLDFITGGQNEKAQEELSRALSQMQDVQTPTAADLQLTPLQEFTDTGNLTPAQMEAAAAGPSAFNNENLSSVPMSTMQQVLAKENEIASSNGMTPQEQAAIARAEETVNANDAGQRGAIAQDFAGRGVPASLIAAALQNATIGQNAQQEHMDALNAHAGAANNALTAMSNEGSLAGTMNAQQNAQANTVAEAQNALNQFNAANTQQARTTNTANQQAANMYDTTAKQKVADQNTGLKNETQIQNQVNAPQEAAGLALQKGQDIAGIGANQANQSTAAGQQAAGLTGSLIGAAATIAAADGGEIPSQRVPETAFLRGGPVPGHAAMPGNDSRNDTVHARLSPGEFVVPRTAMENPAIRDFLAKNVPTPRPPTDTAHPSDVASLLKALSMLRGGAA